MAKRGDWPGCPQSLGGLDKRPIQRLLVGESIQQRAARKSGSAVRRSAQGDRGLQLDRTVRPVGMGRYARYHNQWRRRALRGKDRIASRLPRQPRRDSCADSTYRKRHIYRVRRRSHNSVMSRSSLLEPQPALGFLPAREVWSWPKVDQRRSVWVPISVAFIDSGFDRRQRAVTRLLKQADRPNPRFRHPVRLTGQAITNAAHRAYGTNPISRW